MASASSATSPAAPGAGPGATPALGALTERHREPTAPRLAIAGVGAVGGFGTGRPALQRAILTPPGPNATESVATRHGSVARPVFRADLSALTEVVERARLRRIDRFSQMAALGAHLALEDAGLLDLDRQRVGVILATGYGANDTTFRFLDSCLDYGDAGASPILFSGSGHSGALSNATILLGITGPVLTLCQPHLAVPAALLTAAQWLAEGRVDAVLLGGQEECFPLLFHVREELGARTALDSRPGRKPGCQGPPPGEGCAFLCLTAPSLAGTGHAGIAGIELGRLAEAPPRLPPDVPILSAADDLRHAARAGLGTWGAPRAGESLPAALTSAVFGSMPSHLAFSLVIAAVASEDERLYAVLLGTRGRAAGKPGGTAAGTVPAHRQACCFEATDGEFGMVMVRAIRPRQTRPARDAGRPEATVHGDNQAGVPA